MLDAFLSEVRCLEERMLKKKDHSERLRAAAAALRSQFEVGERTTSRHSCRKLQLKSRLTSLKAKSFAYREQIQCLEGHMKVSVERLQTLFRRKQLLALPPQDSHSLLPSDTQTIRQHVMNTLLGHPTLSAFFSTVMIPHSIHPGEVSEHPQNFSETELSNDLMLEWRASLSQAIIQRPLLPP